MRIALTVHDLHEFGGHSLYARILADELSQKHEVAVFANRCERPSDARWQSYHVPAWRINSLATVKTFPFGIRFQEKQLRGFGIRHAQGYCGGRPNVVTAHRCMASYVKSLSSISIRHWMSVRLMLRAEAHFYRNYSGAVIAISEQIANELQSYYRITGPITIIPHGVNVERFRSGNRDNYRGAVRRELGLKETDMVALYVGDLTKAHVGLRQLAEAVPEITVVIVSPSKNYHWAAPNVKFVPHSRQIERYYASADAFVFPTVNDPFGMVVLEAMASGLPVFTSDQAGAAELINSGEDGFVFSLRDWVTNTAEGLRAELRLREVGVAAEKTARGYDWRRVISAVEKVYEQVLSSPYSHGGR